MSKNDIAGDVIFLTLLFVNRLHLGNRFQLDPKFFVMAILFSTPTMLAMINRTIFYAFYHNRDYAWTIIDSKTNKI